jgi:hypothetical protein
VVEYGYQPIVDGVQGTARTGQKPYPLQPTPVVQVKVVLIGDAGPLPVSIRVGEGQGEWAREVTGTTGIKSPNEACVG